MWSGGQGALLLRVLGSICLDSSEVRAKATTHANTTQGQLVKKEKKKKKKRKCEENVKKMLVHCA